MKSRNMNNDIYNKWRVGIESMGIIGVMRIGIRIKQRSRIWIEIEEGKVYFSNELNQKRVWGKKSEDYWGSNMEMLNHTFRSLSY